MKSIIKITDRLVIKIPIIYRLVEHLYYTKSPTKFPGSKYYWEHRYKMGKKSGAGSYGRLAEFKAETLNAFVKKHNIKSIIEFGSGDGYQLLLAEYPQYIGLDVSPTAIQRCKNIFGNDKTKSFFLYDSLCFIDNQNVFRAELILSLDVIYHLIEDHIFHEYMKALFSTSNKYVIIYSSNFNEEQSYHERHRKFTKWIEANEKNWRLDKKINNKYPFDPSDPRNTSKSDFYIFKKR